MKILKRAPIVILTVEHDLGPELLRMMADALKSGKPAVLVLPEDAVLVDVDGPAVVKTGSEGEVDLESARSFLMTAELTTAEGRELKELVDLRTRLP
jgi:hypothetical protein